MVMMIVVVDADADADASQVRRNLRVCVQVTAGEAMMLRFAPRAALEPG